MVVVLNAKLNTKLDDQGHQETLTIGSCGLLILYEALESNIQEVNWRVVKLIRTIYWLTCMKRCIFETRFSEFFPLKFCETRWIEDLLVANRALTVWDIVRETAKFWESLAKSRQPKNKPYHVILDHCKDPLVPARLRLFISFVSFFKKFFVLFQTDNPIIPFTKDKLEKTVKQLVQLVYKKSAMDEIETNVNIIQTPFVNDKENSCENIDVGSGIK